MRTALALTALAGVAPTWTHDAEQAEVQADPNENIVTAQFRDQKLQDVPIAITAITGDALDARSQTNLNEIANQAPRA